MARTEQFLPRAALQGKNILITKVSSLIAFMLIQLYSGNKTYVSAVVLLI